MSDHSVIGPGAPRVPDGSRGLDYRRLDRYIPFYSHAPLQAFHSDAAYLAWREERRLLLLRIEQGLDKLSERFVQHTSGAFQILRASRR